ncbi:HIRAN domain-containing protein [Pseudomonas anguilliseptica]|uniref:HIRAN domain-containing protein n=1 Tax=Pseudomonas anguilliseptica TaxID=53406 RepID=UPI003736BB8E
MSTINHVFEPSRLLLTWLQPIAEGVIRNRRIVAELTREDGTVALHYLKNTPDFEQAIKEGFTGFPAFDISQVEHRNGVEDAFMRRLPPKKREDYVVFLAQHHLPGDFSGSNFALLGLTGARLPSDSFELCPDLASAEIPIDVLIEVAGFRHHGLKAGVQPQVGDSVTFMPDQDNMHDTDAVGIFLGDQKIGHLNRALCNGMKRLMAIGSLSGSVIRVNGKPERPLIHIMASFR